MESKKSPTPLQLLAQTCNSIGLPDPPSKSKSILPLTEASSVKHRPVTIDRSEKGKSSESSEKDKTGSPSGRSTADGHRSPKNDIPKMNLLGQSGVGQALPPTLPPTGVAPKCGGCVPSYPGSLLASYPILPPSSTGLYGSGIPGPPPGAYSASLHAAAAAAASMPPFFPPCREPYCRVCPPGGPMPGSAPPPPMPNGRCPFGCFHCTPSAHDFYLLSAAASGHPLLSGGFPGLPPPMPPASLASFPGLNSFYNPALAAMAAGVASPQGATIPPQMPVASTTASAVPITSANPPTTTQNSATSQSHLCHWETCAKRFANSDELREHLNSHIQQDSSSTSDNAKTPPTPTSHSAPAATVPSTPPAQPPTPASTATPPVSSPGSTAAPPMTTTATLCTPVSRPYSPRSMLAALHRYHPYKTPVSLPGPLHLGFGPVALGYPSLAGLYGAQRLPGSLPHP